MAFDTSFFYSNSNEWSIHPFNAHILNSLEIRKWLIVNIKNFPFGHEIPKNSIFYHAYHSYVQEKKSIVFDNVQCHFLINRKAFSFHRIFFLIIVKSYGKVNVFWNIFQFHIIYLLGCHCGKTGVFQTIYPKSTGQKSAGQMIFILKEFPELRWIFLFWLINDIILIYKIILTRWSSAPTTGTSDNPWTGFSLTETFQSKLNNNKKKIIFSV